MTRHIAPAPSSTPLDQLVAELLGCGAVLSQMISSMVRFEASGRSSPDAAPIPDVAHSLVRDVLGGVAKRYSNRDIKVAAAIVKEATRAITEDIFFVAPEFLDDTTRGASELN
jgi:hypothetical protein